jgi:hypothetical protein
MPNSKHSKKRKPLFLTYEAVVEGLELGFAIPPQAPVEMITWYVPGAGDRSPVTICSSGRERN